MKKICVYTCITGEYDNLQEISCKEPGVDYICFTNNNKLKSKTWEIVYIEDEKLSNIQLARKVKILGTDRLKQYDVAVWLDGQVSFGSSVVEFVENNVDLESYDLVGFKHYCRDTIQSEMDACYEHDKESLNNLLVLSDYYKQENFLDDMGLIETTVLFRNFNNMKMYETMKIWFDMIINYSHRDQLSFGYAHWKTQIKVNLLNINIWDNEYFETLGHSKSVKINLKYLCSDNKGFDIQTMMETDYVCEDEVRFCFEPKIETSHMKIYISSDKCIKIKKYSCDKDVRFFNCAPLKGEMYLSSKSFIIIDGDMTPDAPVWLDVELDVLGNDANIISVLANISNEMNEIQVNSKMEIEKSEKRISAAFVSLDEKVEAINSVSRQLTDTNKKLEKQLQDRNLEISLLKDEMAKIQSSNYRKKGFCLGKNRK